jgi:hypothetical protein
MLPLKLYKKKVLAIGTATLARPTNFYLLADKQITAFFILGISLCERSAYYFLDVIAYKQYLKHL